VLGLRQLDLQPLGRRREREAIGAENCSSLGDGG